VVTCSVCRLKLLERSGDGDGEDRQGHDVRLRVEYLRACFYEGGCFTLPLNPDMDPAGPRDAGGTLLEAFQIITMSAEGRHLIKTSPSSLHTRLVLPAMVQFFEIWSEALRAWQWPSPHWHGMWLRM